MEDFLKSVEAPELLGPLEEMGFSSFSDLALCEAEDLVADLAVDADKAQSIVQKARDAAALETRKATIQQTWKAVQDSLSVGATQLFYQRLFAQHPTVKPLFADADMDAQAEKLYKTVSLAVDYLNDMENLVPVLQELGARVRAFLLLLLRSLASLLYRTSYFPLLTIYCLVRAVHSQIRTLRKLSQHANEWHAEREHYTAVGECLLWTLKTGLGDAWTPDVADAWTW